jgi:hypothetical protein
LKLEINDDGFYLSFMQWGQWEMPIQVIHTEQKGLGQKIWGYTFML